MIDVIDNLAPPHVTFDLSFALGPSTQLTSSVMMPEYHADRSSGQAHHSAWHRTPSRGRGQGRRASYTSYSSSSFSSNTTARGGGGGRGGGRSRSSDPYLDSIIHETLDHIHSVARSVPPSSLFDIAIAPILPRLDSRLLTSILKALISSGYGESAWAIFGSVQQLAAPTELSPSSSSAPLEASDIPSQCRRLNDVFVYTAMISSCADEGASGRGGGKGITLRAGESSISLALNLSREMQERGVERNVHTFSALMNVCIKAGQYQRALSEYEEMIEVGCRPNIVLQHPHRPAGKDGAMERGPGSVEEVREPHTSAKHPICHFNTHPCPTPLTHQHSDDSNPPTGCLQKGSIL